MGLRTPAGPRGEVVLPGRSGQKTDMVRSLSRLSFGFPFSINHGSSSKIIVDSVDISVKEKEIKKWHGR